MEKKPENRLGVKNFKEIKNHPFFNDINFKKVFEKKIPPPKIFSNKNKDNYVEKTSEVNIFDK